MTALITATVVGHINRRTKMWIFNSNVKSVLMYGRETRRVSQHHLQAAGIYE